MLHGITRLFIRVWVLDAISFLPRWVFSGFKLFKARSLAWNDLNFIDLKKQEIGNGFALLVFIL